MSSLVSLFFFDFEANVQRGRDLMDMEGQGAVCWGDGFWNSRIGWWKGRKFASASLSKNDSFGKQCGCTMKWPIWWIISSWYAVLCLHYFLHRVWDRTKSKVQQDTNIHLDLDAAAGSPETNMTWMKQQDPSSKFSKWLIWDSDESPKKRLLSGS